MQDSQKAYVAPVRPELHPRIESRPTTYPRTQDVIDAEMREIGRCAFGLKYPEDAADHELLERIKSPLLKRTGGER